MEGFGVHTFRFINAKGVSHFVKFHWKPKLGKHALAWDEAQKIAGKDPDFHRRRGHDVDEEAGEQGPQTSRLKPPPPDERRAVHGPLSDVGEIRRGEFALYLHFSTQPSSLNTFQIAIEWP